MTKPPVELAEIFRSLDIDLMERNGQALTSEQRRVMRDIMQCRTAALGGHLERCDQCGHIDIAYDSCRNRHCPKCQASARAKWLEERAADLLPVGYFHVVFTLPDQLSSLALQNRRHIYGLLFKAASETLLEIAADPRRLGAEIGFLAVLHTWGQTLQHHPHLHCIVPGGGLSPDHSRWISCRKRFFLPVKVLSRLFRRKFVAGLRKAFEEGSLVCAGKLSALAQKALFEYFLGELSRLEWVVYAKPPFGSPEQVLKYLARYTHRVAISNHRLLEFSDGRVKFSYKDYAAGNAVKAMTLDAQEFSRRFLLHVLPKGFVRIRHYGFLANRGRQEKLELCRRLIEQSAGQISEVGQNVEKERQVEPAPGESFLCPVCRKGRMITIDPLMISTSEIIEASFAAWADSS
jgi:hypothetical protein